MFSEVKLVKCDRCGMQCLASDEDAVAAHRRYHDVRDAEAREIRDLVDACVISGWKLVQDSLGSFEWHPIKSSRNGIMEAVDYAEQRGPGYLTIEWEACKPNGSTIDTGQGIDEHLLSVEPLQAIKAWIDGGPKVKKPKKRKGSRIAYYQHAGLTQLWST